MIERNVPPFVIVSGDRARVRGLNRVGLERAEVPEESRRALLAAYRMLFGGKAPLAVGLRAVESELGRDPYVGRLIASMVSPVNGT